MSIKNNDILIPYLISGFYENYTGSLADVVRASFVDLLLF